MPQLGERRRPIRSCIQIGITKSRQSQRLTTTNTQPNIIAFFLPHKSDNFPAVRQPKKPPACMIAIIVPIMDDVGLNCWRNCSCAIVVVMTPES